MNIVEEILDVIKELRKIDWDERDERFVRQITSLFNLIGIESDDVEMSIEELKSSTFILEETLEDVIDFYEDDYLRVKEILNEYIEDLKGISITLTNEQARILLLNEVFKGDM